MEVKNTQAIMMFFNEKQKKKISDIRANIIHRIEYPAGVKYVTIYEQTLISAAMQSMIKAVSSYSQTIYKYHESAHSVLYSDSHAIKEFKNKIVHVGLEIQSKIKYREKTVRSIETRRDSIRTTLYGGMEWNSLLKYINLVDTKCLYLDISNMMFILNGEDREVFDKLLEYNTLISEILVAAIVNMHNTLERVYCEGLEETNT